MESLMGSKLAEVLNKLINGNKLSSYQAIEKINTYLIEFKTNEPQRRKLINNLFETMPSILSKNCCISLLSMLNKNCQTNVIDLAYLVSCLLSLINSKTENSIYCLYALTDLMIFFHEQFIQKYSIRNPSHPFIEILRNSNESRDNLHYLVFKQIQIIYENEKITAEVATNLLKPVFIYVFLEKSDYKHLVAQHLIKLINKSNQLVNLISIYFSFLKIDELARKEVHESLKSLIQIVFIPENVNKTRFQFIKIIELLIKIDLHHSLCCSTEWIMLKSWIKNDTHTKKHIDDILLTLLAANLSRISSINLESYLEFIIACVESYENETNLCLAIFVPNLLEYVLSFSALEYDEKYKSLKSQILKILTIIEKRIYQKNQTETFDSNKLKIFDLMSYEQRENILKDPNESCNRENLNLLCAYFVLNDTDLELTKKITNLFKKLSARLPYLSILFFSLYINKIKMSSNQNIVFHLITTLIDLIVPKVDVNLFFNVINYLMDSSNEDNLMVKLICLKQLTRLCIMKYDYVIYPRLSKELVNLNYEFSNDKNRLKVLFTKAFCIHQLILYRPDYYAQELLATISSLINNCNRQEDAGICAILIDAMAFLCHSEVIDIESTFNALYPQFKAEKRLLVLNAYCRLISEVSSREDLYSAENPDNFYDKMIKQLWSLCKPTDSDTNIDTSESALIGLSQFKRSYLKCSFFPEYIQEKLRIKNKSLMAKEQNLNKTIDEVFEKIPATCFFDLFYSLNPNAYNGLSKLLQKFLIEEIDSIPRRLISSAQEKEMSVDDQQRIQKSFYKLIEDFLTKEFNLSLNDQSNKSKVDGAYLTYCYDSPVELNSYGKPVKRQIPVNWKNYENSFILLLTKCKFDFDEKLLKNLTNGLDRFVYKTYESCINALEFNLKSTLEENHKKVEEDEKHLSIISRNKLLQILIDSYKESVQKSSELSVHDYNLFILSFASLVESTSKFMLIYLKNDKTIIQDQSKWLEVIVDLILNVNENKISTKNEFLNTFSYGLVFKVEELDFMYEIFKNTSSMNKYFLSKIQPVCIELEIKNYLIQYLERAQLDLYDSDSDDKLSLESFGRYVQNFIKTKIKFNEIDNTKVNSLLKKLHTKCFYLLEKQSRFDLIKEYLRILTECLNCLYDEESVFYDEDSLLESLLNKLSKPFEDKTFPFNNDLYFPVTYNFVNLNCIAYKSNLITNEHLIKIYQSLSKDSKLNGLNAFYCRFLLFFGYSEAHIWLEFLYSKWMKELTDFKLNLTKDLVELEHSIEGLLASITGVSLDCVHFKQISYFTEETDKMLKPEQTLREIIKLFKSPENEIILNDIKQKIKFILSIMYLNHIELKYEAIYSMPNTYDYLDESSILRVSCTELNQMAKSLHTNDTNTKQFEFLVNLLLNSCKNSQTLTLPPLNWYFFISSLLKSKFGKSAETTLLNLVILQLKISNSAHTFIKNILIDTNYFSNLKFESQLLIFKSLNVIWSRLDRVLLVKFLNKIKIFLKQNCKDYDSSRNQIFTCILDSLEEFSKTYRENKNDNYAEILDFYLNIYSEFSFDITDPCQKSIANKLAETLIKFDDELIIDYLNALEKVPEINQKFLMIFYIKCRLVSLQHKPIFFITNSVTSAILLVEKYTDEFSKNIFINVFMECMLIQRNRAYIESNKASAQKSTNLINSAFNWIIEFMEIVKLKKDITDSQLEFALSIFSCFCYAWSNQWTSENDQDIHIANYYLDNSEINKNIGLYLKKLIQIPFWKQITTKLIEMLIYLCSLRITNLEIHNNIQMALVELFLIIEDLNAEIWFKCADIISQSRI